MLIHLTRCQVAFIDNRDFPKVSHANWFALKTRSGFYAATTGRSNGKQVILLMHRLIMDAPVGVEVDHKDGNGLNNQRNNLRLCSHAQNQHNARIYKIKKSSRYKGVCYSSRSRRRSPKRWRASIAVDGKAKHIGWFLTEDEAAEAYNRSASRFYGEFARLNEIARGV